MVLKLQGNPCTANAENKFAYRKDYVIELCDLEVLDKLNVLPAERLYY